jgi:membrane associated rhomboid family serine protease
MGKEEGTFSGLLADLPRLVPRAPATFLIAVACVGVFVRFQVDGGPRSEEEWARWGVVGLDRVLGGHAWGLLTSCVIHANAIHLLFNLWWMWELGVRIETWLGTWRYVALVVVSALASSFAQGIASYGLGIGMSGVVYALFGFAWISRPRRPELADVAHPRNVTWMVLWLAGCFVATELGYANIGNAAHVSGLALGALLAFAVIRKRAWAYAGLAAMLLALAAGAAWRT